MCIKNVYFLVFSRVFVCGFHVVIDITLSYLFLYRASATLHAPLMSV